MAVGTTLGREEPEGRAQTELTRAGRCSAAASRPLVSDLAVQAIAGDHPYIWSSLTACGLRSGNLIDEVLGRLLGLAAAVLLGFGSAGEGILIGCSSLVRVRGWYSILGVDAVRGSPCWNLPS